MLDSEDSTVTYTEVSSPFEGLLDIGSPGVEPKQAPPLPDFVPELVYLEFTPPEDEVFPAEEQPLPAAASPGYVSESDSEEDTVEDPKEDPVDYPADRGDDGDDEDESSDDDDDDVDIEGDKEKEEHPTPADYTTISFPAVEHALSAEETEPFETDESAATPPPHPAYHVTARMSIRVETPISLPSREEVDRLLALPSPPPSPLSPWSSPLPQIPSPPLPVSSPVPVSPPPLPASLTYSLGYRAAMIWLRAEAPFTSHPLPLPSPIVLPRTRAYVAMLRAAAPSTYILAPRSEAPPSETPPLLPIPLPTPLPPFLLPSTDRRADVREACLPPRKRLCFAFGPRYEVGESSSAPTARPDGDFRRDYGFITPLADEIMRDQREMLLMGLPTPRMRCSWDIDEIYGRLDDAQTEQQMVTSRVNMLVRDRRAHARIARLMEIEDRMSREAWGWSMDASDLASDRRRQTQLTEALKLMKTLQTQLTALQSRQGPARGPAQPDAPEEAARDAIRSTNGEDNHNSGTRVRRNERATRECTYPDFMKCQPLNFNVTEGVVELTQWVEKMEIVFRISNYSTELKKKTTDKCCPRTEIKKLEVELWDLKVK
ncbi:hypothetical protein Tco_1074733, partial [Tanacetum coccineum]